MAHFFCKSARNAYFQSLWAPILQLRFRPLIAFLLSVTGILLTTHSSYGQTPTITYPVQAQDLTRGYGQAILTVKVVFNGACTGATTAKIALPASVVYVPGSATKTSGTGSVNIAENNITNLSSPVFNFSGITAAGNEITFTIARRATCGTLATAKDSVYVFSSGGCGNGSELASTVNTYNLLSPSLALTQPPALTNTVVGATATRTTTVTNGGNGVLDTLRFYIVYPSAGILNTSGTNTITANGSSFVPSNTNGDTLFYKIYGTTLFGGNNLLSNGETVTITEPIKVVKCNSSTIYGAGWGRTKATQCQIATGTSAITMASGTPVLTASVTSGTPAAPCIPGTKNWQISNNGSGGNAGAIYNVVVSLNNGSTSKIALSNANVGGNTAALSTVLGGYGVDLSQFTSDPDGTGGLEDLDGDGQYDDLAPGRSFILHLDEAWNCSNACPISYNSYDQVVLIYKTMCGASVTSNAFVSSIRRLVVTSASAFAPSFVYGGQAFDARVCATVSGNTAPGSVWPTDSLYLKLTLPAGLGYVTGSASINGVAVASGGAYVTGTTLYIRAKGTINNGSVCVDFKMIYTCGATNPDLSIPVELYNVKNSACNCAERLFCDALTVKVFCPGTELCPNGMGNYGPNAQRLSLGWTDRTLSTKVSAASLTNLSRKSAVPFDTVQISQSALGGAIAYNNLHYKLSVDKVTGQAALKPIGGTLYLKRGTNTFNCVIPSVDSSASTSSQSVYNWDLGSLFGSCLAGITGVQAGDSVYVAINYLVTNANAGLLFGNKQTQAPNTKSNFYNLDITGAEQSCGGLPVELYLIGLQTTLSGSQSTNVTACNDATSIAISTGLNYSEALDLFPNEFRPQSAVDSVVITWPAGDYTFSNLGASVRGTFWSSKYTSTTTSAFGVSPSTNIPGKLTFINPSGNVWQLSDLANTGVGSINLSLTGWQPNCSTPVSSVFNYTVYYRNNFYRTPASVPQTVQSSALQRGYNLSTKAAISVQNNTGVVQGILPQHYWDVQINSIGGSPAQNVWLALEKSATSGIEIDSVVLKPSNVVLTAHSYGTSNKWYQVGTFSGISQQARVYFKYTNCTIDLISMKAGWNCTGYPTPDPTAYACTVAQTNLVVDPKPSQVQLSIARQPGNGSSINLCQADSALLIINSAQAANLVNPYIVFYPPTGVTMASTIQIEYPLGSGNYQPAIITAVSGGGYKIDLSAHPGIGVNGMLGTASSNPAFVPLGGDRQAKIKLDYTTSCGFVSGSSFSFYAYGKQPCGSPAIGDGISATTSALNITGTTAPGSAGIIMNINGSTVATCQSALSFTSAITPTGVPTQSGDAMVYTLPVGLLYAGNLTSGFVATLSSSGLNQIVTVTMPVGTAPGTQINYSFDVIAGGSGCGSGSVTAVYQRSVPPLSCQGTPCSTGSVVIATGSSSPITMTKPALSITNVQLLSGTLTPGGALTVNLTVANNATVNAPGSSYMVEVFCGSGTTPFAQVYYPTAILAGTSTTGNISFTVPASGSGCVSGSMLTYKIRPATENGTIQCMCNETSFTQATPLPVSLLNFTVSVGRSEQNTFCLLNWETTSETNSDHFEIQHSMDAKNWSDVGKVVAVGESTMINKYSFTDLDAIIGLNYYRLKMVDKDNTYAFSRINSVNLDAGIGIVYPNPASESITLGLDDLKSVSSVEIFDTKGIRLIKTAKLVSNKINIEKLPTGTYLVKITRTSGAVIVQKIVKQ